ncbi:hypothetical protein C7974DRAFT_418707 [Boeremia exigua]|uniref:uncharacterized protein n=1 Tax=Boeremia exigua TaxID=749465 RepID=UPI001E8D23F0|nr:uncharacterized protein C7974DRAFT_418707 [Boeremia exigua]KAH6611793.1 hypothetical protein C7974DRAFT_418707 [Boeremia exigua]
MLRKLNRAQREKLDNMLEREMACLLDAGMSWAEAYAWATEAVYEATGCRPKVAVHRTRRDAACREHTYVWRYNQRGTEAKRRYHRTTQSGTGAEFDHMFQNGADYSDLETTGRILDVDEFMWRANIMTNLLQKGINEDYARQQGERVTIRELGKRNDAGLDGVYNARFAPRVYRGQRARKATDDRARSDSPHRPHASMSSRECPQYSDYFTHEPGDDLRARHETPRQSSRSSYRGYRTEERRPGGISSSNFDGCNDRSGWYGYSGNRTPPLEASGVKPAEDLYVLLGVQRSAGLEDIKQAHRRLCMKHHPDRVKGDSIAKQAATEKMAQINQACDVLKDKEMQAFYDRTGMIGGLSGSLDA